MGQVWGYARVSTEDQDTGLQRAALLAAGVPEANIVEEKASGGARAVRPLYQALLARLGAGDTLAVWKVDRLGRSTVDALQTAKDLDARGVRIVITTLGADLTTPAGRLVFGVLAQVAEFERELIRERIVAGMAAAKKRPDHPGLGRRHTLNAHQREEAARMHAGGKSLAEIAALFRCGRSVVHRAIVAEQGRVVAAGSAQGSGRLVSP